MLQVMFCNHYLLERRKLMVGKLLHSLGGHLNTSKSQQPREAAFKYDNLTCKKKGGGLIYSLDVKFVKLFKIRLHVNIMGRKQFN